MRDMNAVMLFVVLCAGVAQAGEHGFESTSEGIVRRLLAPKQEKGSAAGNTPDLPQNTQSNVRELGVLFQEGTNYVKKHIKRGPALFVGAANLKVPFGSKSRVIRSDAFPILDQLGTALNEPALLTRHLTINGHTDEDGTEDENLQLSIKRALAVKSYLHVVTALLSNV